jgi:hypothetical protein
MPQWKYQRNGWECGTRAIQNAFIALGVDYIDRDEIKGVARTTRSEGTSKRGVVRAVKFHGFIPTEYQTRDKELAWRWALRNAAKYPCIVLVDEWAHWALMSGVMNKRVTMIDSSDLRDGTIGAYSMDKEELLDRWIGRGVYYAIRVKPG